MIVLFFVVGCSKERPGKKPDNIILISIDTLRADHLGCYGYPRDTSPAIDKFASGALLFEDVSSPSPWTLPAHASLLTGLYPSHNRVRTRSNRLPADVMTLAKVLRQQGFVTSAIVNSHWLSKRNGLHQGFDYFTYVMESVTQVKPSEVEDKAYKWLLKHRAKPFFLFLHFYDVHSDYRSLPRYEKLFARPYNGKADGTTAQLLHYRKGRGSLDKTDAKHLIDLYDAGIRQMDDGIARLFKFLKKKKLFDNSLIIITADHGEEFLEHGGVLHGRTQFQEVIQVPLIMRGPGLPRRKRIKTMASLIDIMPTILGLLDIAQPAPLDGIDLRHLWQKTNGEPPLRLLFGEADWNNMIQSAIVDDIKRAVRHNQYKLHYNLLTKKKELYDLLEDPHENSNVIEQHPSLADSLFRVLKNFMSVEVTGKSVPALSTKEIELLKSLGYLQ